MQNRDDVIRHAARAAENQAHEVRHALRAFLEDADRNTRALRDALCAQAAEFESAAHDGSTRSVRVQASKDALKAWDGDLAEVRMGSHALRVPKDLVGDLDLRDVDQRLCLAQALDEFYGKPGATHEVVFRRALSLWRVERYARKERDSAERVARFQFEAAEQNKIAQAIQAKANKT